MKRLTNMRRPKSGKALITLLVPMTIATFVVMTAIGVLQMSQTAVALEEVKVSREISAPIDKVWNIVSNVDNETKYWPTFKAIKNVNEADNTTEREVTITAGPLGDQNTHQFVTVNPEQFQVQTNITEGPFTGTRLLTLSPSENNAITMANVVWQMDLSGIPVIGQGFAKDGIKQTTEAALGNIAEEAESK